MSNAVKEVLVPAVLAVNRSMVISDGLFYGLKSASPDAEKRIIPVIRHGIRGTQNTSAGATESSETAQIQSTESAKTFHEDRALRVEFSFRPLNLVDCLASCSGRGASVFRKSYVDFIDRAADSDGLREVCYRMARNVFNGRWLWRNRQIGVGIVTHVKVGDEEMEQDALSTPLNHFDEFTPNEKRLGDIMANMFVSDDGSSIQVYAIIDLGMTGSVEVYPSQNYVDKKPKGFARPLYKVDVKQISRHSESPMTFEDTRITGFAALRDQKIWNAIRTIDTWYEGFADHGLPIPVEPLGANLSADCVFRNLKNGSLFDYLPRLDFLDPDSDQGKFVIASLIRGGVLGMKDPEKAKKQAAEKKKKADDNKKVEEARKAHEAKAAAADADDSDVGGEV